MSGTNGGNGQSLPTGVITFLLTDIEGSTKRWLEHSADMGDAVERHNGILVSAVEGRHGFDLEKRSEGDGRFAVFSSARSALEAALDIQRGLAAQDWTRVSGLRVRIALHSGEAELRRNDYFGTVVNRSARMRASAHGGQIILSEATKELLGGHLPDGVTLRDLGFHRFKDLEEADRIFQVLCEGLEDIRTPLNSLSAAKHNLPVQLSSFVGRAGQLIVIPELVRKNRLVTLFGVGGGGKTRLALQVAAEVTDGYSDGVWFVDLAPLQDPELVALTIAQALPIASDKKAPLDAIVDNYAEGKALFVIDNCEHVSANAAVVINDLLRRCPSVKVLATSRQPLSIQGECVYDVPPMDFDLNGQAPTKDIVAQLEAVELLRDRAAKRLSGEDVLSEATAEDIYGICQRVDGIPLAIEQAAAGLAYMSVADLRRRLDQHFDIELQEVGVPKRQQTMEAAISWSVNLLNESEKKLFILLSVFDGGCSAQAAEFVCSDSMAETPVGRVLEALAKRSLITYSRLSSRYRMLEPIRQFAAERLPGEQLNDLRSKHFEWFYNVSVQAKEAGLEADGDRFYKLLNADYDNIRKSLAWGSTHRVLAVKTVELCNALYAFWLRRGLIREGTTWFQQAMNATSEMPESVRAEALLFLGILQWQGNNFASADRALQASHEAFDKLGDEVGRARAYGNLGNMAFSQREFSKAYKIYLEVIPTFEKMGNHRALATTLENLGVCESEMDLLDDAIAHLLRSILLHREISGPTSLAKALDALLGVYGLRGELREHKKEYLEAGGIALGEKEDDNFLFGNLLDTGCQLLIELQEYLLAAQAFGAMDLAHERSQRTIFDSQMERHAKMKELLIEKLGLKAFEKAVRDGRALGPRAMLGLISRWLEGEG